jgi:uncharacterized membrane protein
MDLVAAFARWFHYLAGVMWIGLLYYFNFVQVQALGQANAAADGSAAGITKFVAPRALQYFRWSALVTWVMGALLLTTFGGMPALGAAFSLQAPYTGIGVGAWLGTIMLFNVWVLIYPNQMKILGKVPATDEQKAKARRVAFLASRTNTMLSIPMLFFMAFGFHHAGDVGFRFSPR